MKPLLVAIARFFNVAPTPLNLALVADRLGAFVAVPLFFSGIALSRISLPWGLAVGIPGLTLGAVTYLYTRLYRDQSPTLASSGEVEHAPNPDTTMPLLHAVAVRTILPAGVGAVISILAIPFAGQIAIYALCATGLVTALCFGVCWLDIRSSKRRQASG